MIEQLNQKKRTAIPPKEQRKKVQRGPLIVFTSEKLPGKVCIGFECDCGKNELPRIVLTDDGSFSILSRFADPEIELTKKMQANTEATLQECFTEGETVSTGFIEFAIYGHGPTDKNGMFDLLAVIKLQEN